MSPVRNINEIKTNQSTIIRKKPRMFSNDRFNNTHDEYTKVNPITTTVRREKVQFHKVNNTRMNDLNSTFKNDDRFISTVPEVSAIFFK